MKIFPVRQISEIDHFTIEKEPILSINLMERAALAFYNWFLKQFPSQEVHLLVGPGNNGGDALAIARLLLLAGRNANIWLVNPFGRFSKDAEINLHRLKSINSVCIRTVEMASELKVISRDAVIIDGLFGSGLNRSLDGLALDVVQQINQLPNTCVAIDMPSGLFGEDNSENNSNGIIQAHYTVSFQFPKLAFLMPENEKFVGKWEVVDIGLHPEKIDVTNTDWYYHERDEIIDILKQPNKFAHKGQFGHALLMAGSYGKMGAAVLASKGCLKAGVGLLTVHVPHVGYPILQAAVPEAMVSIDRSDYLVSEFPDLSAFNAIGVGPGISQKPNTQKALVDLLKNIRDRSLVLDADAINILAEHKELLTLLPPNTILTPHPGEFDRLAGASRNGYERLQKAIALSEQYKIVVVLKGAHTIVITPAGHCYFNSTGNPGMATAGSGDVLTGIILSLLAQKYAPVEAARLGVYMHGLAGDIVYLQESYEGVTAGCIIEALGSAFKQLRR
ncbi:MAG: NAD(P)H-hydrate dehydratase [Marinilabiliaceae bacterium]|nr:NAD(P)H-hydrate dehydratase [Marinilabiliaceae bacterium]